MRPAISRAKLTFLFSLTLLAFVVVSSAADSWWNKEWTIRKKITVDTTATGVPITDPIGSTQVLIRLHDGNFQFVNAKEDASDIRFVAADDKTLLPFHIEKYDGLLNEAFVWVRVPDLKPGAQTAIWLYYGNAGEKAVKTEDSKATYDDDTVVAYHFNENGTPPADASAAGNNAKTAGVAVGGSLIGGGVRLTGKNAVTIDATPSLAWPAGAPLTWSAWVKSMALQANGVIFSRTENGNGLAIGEDSGVPYVEVTDTAGAKRTPAGAALPINVWRHLAVVATGTQITLYVDGTSYATLDAAIPALNSSLTLGFTPAADGAADADATGFSGEIDELQISKAARPAGMIKLFASNQSGADKDGSLLALANDESTGHSGGGELSEHLTLFADISKSLTFDGWVVIVLCAILAVVGWIVAINKWIYLNEITKATGAFLKQWEHIASDLTVLDHGDEQSIKSMGGKATTKEQKLMLKSPLYHIYQIGSQEIQHRQSNTPGGFKGLSGRSMQAIRATLDGGLVREVQRLNQNLVFLTIGIAGGPYLGLLGTVIGVMITFAVIAKSGEVEVNSIAPGIAGALLATVAGLVVAIPALFAYSYISSRIKTAVSEMQIFIDEFVAKIAEFYPSSSE